MFINTYAPYGADGIIIRVEADIRRGIPGIDITGLAQEAVREARERVRAAFRNSGFVFPQDRVLINLAPAGLRKDGAALDLPIALAVMTAAGIFPQSGDTEGGELLVMGELELSGRIRPVRGVLAATAAALKLGIREFIVPAENAREAAILASTRVGAAATLAEAAHILAIRRETGSLPPAGLSTDPRAPGTAGTGWGDFAEVRGQERYKRALEIAAAGGHNLLVFGPPGAGKTMLARRLPSIMAPLTPEEAVEVTRLHSLAGRTIFESEGRLISHPPFRSPHHSASAEGILGGGKTVRPGEISLAHFGALFLDEAPEFRKNVIQSLREPLEDRMMTISRADGPVRLPADFQLILAANPCPCGRLGMRPGQGAQGCFCSAEEIRRYWRKFGAALLDRVELRLAVSPPELGQMTKPDGENSADIARRVLYAVEIQRERFKKTGIRRNARMSTGMIDRFCPLSANAETAFRTAAEKLGLSGRAYHGALRVARTIADLEGAESIKTVHILEAIQHRRQGDDPYDVFSAGG
ncbi:YifB family Mg chelatase-like AAA ATPase [Treponema primitia]|uniref:YifB family Mg chelatase-like AAA ATPase n=1 Tax=Treponema primitia TaxID=88058 RepID=UPI00398127C1